MSIVNEVFSGVNLVYPEIFPPVITLQPVSGSVIDAGVYQLECAATGLGAIVYQWQQSVDGSSWANVGTPGATYSYTAILRDPAGLMFRCLVTDDTTKSTASSAATVTVTLIPATVTIAPIDPSVTEGDVINFVATATGYGALVYQWNLAGAPISGATAATYDRTAVVADSGGVITCTATDAESQVVVSAGSTMTVELGVHPYDTAITSLGPMVDFDFESEPGKLIDKASGVELLEINSQAIERRATSFGLPGFSLGFTSSGSYDSAVDAFPAYDKESDGGVTFVFVVEYPDPYPATANAHLFGLYRGSTDRIILKSGTYNLLPTCHVMADAFSAPQFRQEMPIGQHLVAVVLPAPDGLAERYLDGGSVAFLSNSDVKLRTTTEPQTLFVGPSAITGSLASADSENISRAAVFNRRLTVEEIALLWDALQ